MQKVFCLFIFLGISNYLISQVTLVKDINPGFGGSFAISVSQVVNNKCYFVADDGVHGHELWLTDGSPAGTKLVKNIYPGSETSNPRAMGFVSDRLLVLADDSTHGLELWSSQGEASNTQLIFDSKSGIGGTTINIPFLSNNTFKTIGQLSYFVNNFNEIFETDGSISGTKSILKLNFISEITTHEGKLYIEGNKETFKDSIFILDPVSKTLRAINTSARSPKKPTSTPLGLIFEAGSRLFIYKSVTNTVEEITPGLPISSYKYTLTNAYVNGHFYLLATLEQGFKPVILKINGKANGTEILVNNAKDNFSAYSNFTSEGNYLYYLYSPTSSAPIELWRTDGTSTGLIKLDEYDPAALNSITASRNIVPYNGKIYYFGTKKKILGLYESDGTTQGTKQLELILDFEPFRQITTGLILLDNTLLFSAQVKGIDIGQELYSYKLPIKTNLIENHGNDKVKIYPNPSHDFLQIILPDNNFVYHLNILTTDGKTILRNKTLSTGSNTIPINHLATGVYNVHISGNGKILWQEQVVIAR